ncbi:MAG: hypothetical protein AB8G05_04490 [Oligoflexales bacterium]
MKAILIILSYGLWSLVSYGQKSKIPGTSYLIFSPEKVEIKDAKIRLPPNKVDKSSFKNEYFQIKEYENTQKVFLLKHSDKKYYKFLFTPFEIGTTSINGDNIEPLVPR